MSSQVLHCSQLIPQRVLQKKKYNLLGKKHVNRLYFILQKSKWKTKKVIILETTPTGCLGNADDVALPVTKHT